MNWGKGAIDETFDAIKQALEDHYASEMRAMRVAFFCIRLENDQYPTLNALTTDGIVIMGAAGLYSSNGPHQTVHLSDPDFLEQVITIVDDALAGAFKGDKFTGVEIHP